MAAKTILVVDDDCEVLVALRTALEQRGYHVVSAADGPTGHLQRPPVCLHRALAGRKLRR